MLIRITHNTVPMEFQRLDLPKEYQYPPIHTIHIGQLGLLIESLWTKRFEKPDEEVECFIVFLQNEAQYFIVAQSEFEFVE